MDKDRDVAAFYRIFLERHKCSDAFDKEHQCTDSR